MPLCLYSLFLHDYNNFTYLFIYLLIVCYFYFSLLTSDYYIKHVITWFYHAFCCNVEILKMENEEICFHVTLWLQSHSAYSSTLHIAPSTVSVWTEKQTPTDSRLLFFLFFFRYSFDDQQLPSSGAFM